VIGGRVRRWPPGSGLLLAGKIDQPTPRRWLDRLVAVGALSTLPLDSCRVLRSRVKGRTSPEPEPAARFHAREYVS